MPKLSGSVTVNEDIEPLIFHHFNNIKYGNTSIDPNGRVQSVFSRQVNHPKLNNNKPTLIPSVYAGEVLNTEESIKAAIDSGIKWTFANSHEELRKYDEKIHKRMSPSLGEKTDGESFNKGGTTMKNNPPVGSLPSEVADDVPAMISEGEFMLPADVVRYVGLDTIHGLMHQAKAGLKNMEEEGLIVDVDENGRPEKPQKSSMEDVEKEMTILKMEPITEVRGGGIMRPYQQGTLALQLGGSPQMPPPPRQMPSGQGMAPPMAPPSNMESQMSGAMGETPPPTAPPPMSPGEGGPQQGAPLQIPSIEAPLIQEFESQPHLLAYINEAEVRMLQEKGGGMTPEGEPRLSPEGIPVFADSSAASEPAAPAAGPDPGDPAEFGGEPAPGDPSSDQPGGGPASAPSPGAGGNTSSAGGFGNDGADDSVDNQRTLAGSNKVKEETGEVGTQTFLGGTHVYRPGVGFVPKESPTDPNAISYAILSGANLANIKPVAANKGVMTQRSGYGAARADQLLGGSKKK